MKKTLTLLSLLVTLVLGMTACGGSVDADTVAKKIQDGAELDKQDYSVMFTYVEEAVGKLEPIMKNAAADPEAAKAEADKLDAEYPHMEAFMNAIMTAPENKIDTKQREKMLGQVMSMLMVMGSAQQSQAAQQGAAEVPEIQEAPADTTVAAE